MAEPNLPNPLKPKEEKFTMESRFLMFFLLMMVVLSITQYFYKPPIQAPVAKKAEVPATAGAIPTPAKIEQPVIAKGKPGKPDALAPAVPTQATEEKTT